MDLMLKCWYFWREHSQPKPLTPAQIAKLENALRDRETALLSKAGEEPHYTDRVTAEGVKKALWRLKRNPELWQECKRLDLGVADVGFQAADDAVRKLRFVQEADIRHAKRIRESANRLDANRRKRHALKLYWLADLPTLVLREYRDLDHFLGEED